LKIPVMIHTGASVFKGARLKYGDPLWIDDVAVDFPDLTLIQAHSGRGFWYRRAFFLARLHQNVYMEIAGLPPQKLLDYFPELEKNADKIIFGSDWPGLRSIRANIAAIRSRPLSEETKARILGQNAARILGDHLPDL
jgi:predicted TIM-barrel fold metal-dependent hydrolase